MVFCIFLIILILLTGNGLEAKHVHASQLPLNLLQKGGENNLHRKRISGKIEANAISLPYSFAFAENEAPPNIVVKGSATFSSEPTVRNANKVDLGGLFPKIWMSTNATHFYGKNLHFANASVEGNVTFNVSKIIARRIFDRIFTIRRTILSFRTLRVP